MLTNGYKYFKTFQYQSVHKFKIFYKTKKFKENRDNLFLELKLGKISHRHAASYVQYTKFTQNSISVITKFATFFH